ncbi:hypothetical protein MTR_5g009040 [Medicago truncatula]|uniref:Uncharacterized protein n=1 Tax=Medicago truncatula TaxID=3880 RepID=G7K9A2_MEDTR|nr:hypothetical protein MTR_5g009040 [Medicago truncatula]
MVDGPIAETLQETLPFARGKIPVKRTESLAKGTFVREKARGGSSGKSAHRKPFARGYTPGRKTRGRTPGITRDLNLGINPGKFPHFCLQIFCNSDCACAACAKVTDVKKV